MKRKLNFKALFANLILAFLFGVVLSMVVGIDPVVATAGVFALGTGLQFVFPDAFPKGVAMAGVYREIWTGELVEELRKETQASFLQAIPDMSRYVQSSAGGENEVIHLVDIGADPEVLINNTSYPIGYETLADGDIAFSLDKFQTKATKVTDDELYAISYDKIAVVNQKHSHSILRTKQSKAIHALAPFEDKAATPIVGTSGTAQGGIKLASVDDIINLAGAMNDAGVPDDGNRLLVMNTKHVTGILKEVKNFYKDYANIGTGELRSLFYGFKVFVYHNMPFYIKSSGEKASFGAVFNSTTHAEASVAFYGPDMFRAEGSTKMYFDEPDTQNQMAAVNYRHHYLVSPKKERAIAALVSKDV